MSSRSIYSILNTCGAITALSLVVIGYAGRSVTASPSYQVTVAPSVVQPWQIVTVKYSGPMQFLTYPAIRLYPLGGYGEELLIGSPSAGMGVIVYQMPDVDPGEYEIRYEAFDDGTLKKLAGTLLTVASPSSTILPAQYPAVSPQDEMACIQDVIQCPDGSYVGRDPENDCQFYPCPTVTPAPAPEPTHIPTITPTSEPSFTPTPSLTPIPTFDPQAGEQLAHLEIVQVGDKASEDNDNLGSGLSCPEGTELCSPLESTLPATPALTPEPAMSPNPSQSPTPATSPAIIEEIAVSSTPIVSPAIVPTPAPVVTITKIDPSMAPPGRLVKIHGSGFTVFNSVILKGSAGTYGATGVSMTGTMLIFFVPNIPSGPYSVSVSNDNGTSNTLPFTVGETMQYTALGDSLARGLSAILGYVKRYEFYIERDNNVAVNVINRGVVGWQSGDLRQAILTDRGMREQVRSSQYVTFNIGGNDLRNARNRYKAGTCGGVDNQDCLRSVVRVFRSNWNIITSEIRSLTAGGDTVVRTMTLYNPYVDMDKMQDSWPSDGGLNDFQALKPYIDQANQHIASSGIPYAHVYKSFNGQNGDRQPVGLISYDGFHPNDAGHARIADLLRGLGYSVSQ